MNGTDSRFSLVSGEGDGAMLGLAAGDSAGGAWQLGYSAVTEQATVIAYRLIATGRLDEQELVTSLLELDGGNGDEPVYRSESTHFRTWLNGTAGGEASPQPGRTLDAGPRAVPLGVVFRKDPEALLEQCLLLGRIFHTDSSPVLSGVVAAGGVAAGCFGQTGRDFIAGLVELLEAAVDVLGLDHGDRVVGQAASLIGHVGVDDGERALQLASGGDEPTPWEIGLAGLLLAASPADRPHLPVAEAARLGGSPLGGMVGGIVGARVGIRAWPWAFANDTWFAEIGRRLVRGPAETEDLPIPYAVEHHLIAGEREGLV